MCECLISGSNSRLCKALARLLLVRGCGIECNIMMEATQSRPTKVWT